jgi:hypothetical protein
LLVSLPAGSAWAGGSKTHVVRPGESIQAAIDAARPGDTILVKPGTSAEALKVTTDNLTLKGSRGTVLTMPGEAELRSRAGGWRDEADERRGAAGLGPAEHSGAVGDLPRRARGGANLDTLRQILERDSQRGSG